MIHSDGGGIPCPVCNTKIPFDVHQLLMGAQFACPLCNAVIGLGQESKAIVRDTLEKLEAIKSRKKESNHPSGIVQA